jgi:hypothetical protein
MMGPTRRKPNMSAHPRVAAAVSYVGGGLLLDAIDAPKTLIIAGAGGMAITALVALVLPRALRRYPAPPSEGGSGVS